MNLVALLIHLLNRIVSFLGNALLPWAKLKPLIILKLEKVIENVTNEEEDLSFLDEKIQVIIKFFSQFLKREHKF